MKSPYVIQTAGCDDANYAFIELTDTEADTVRRVAEALNARSLGECMPTLHLKDWTEATDHEREEATRTLGRD
jgi:hypothetical protein